MGASTSLPSPRIGRRVGQSIWTSADAFELPQRLNPSPRALRTQRLRRAGRAPRRVDHPALRIGGRPSLASHDDCCADHEGRRVEDRHRQHYGPARAHAAPARDGARPSPVRARTPPADRGCPAGPAATQDAPPRRGDLPDGGTSQRQRHPRGLVTPRRYRNQRDGPRRRPDRQKRQREDRDRLVSAGRKRAEGEPPGIAARPREHCRDHHRQPPCNGGNERHVGGVPVPVVHERMDPDETERRPRAHRGAGEPPARMAPNVRAPEATRCRR